MSFEAALKGIAAEIDAVLDRLLPPETIPAGRLAAAMRYAALGQGKRLRPFFVLESATLFGAERGAALRVAAALECVHCYSLVHDDLPAMDDDDLRRGRPSAHRAFDEATAILAGDALLTLAFEIVSSPETHADAALRSTLVLELARAAGAMGMAGGQMLDLLAETAASHDLDGIVRMQQLKTGALFRYACDAGAMLGGASSEDRAALRLYAGNVGLAFQIADDILDVESSPAALGKRSQKDKSRGKATFIDLLGLSGAKSRARTLVDEASAALAPFGHKADTMRLAATYVVSRRA